MNKVMVLGAGRVGRLIATELGRDCTVVVCDNNTETRTLSALPNIQVELADLSIPAIIKLLIKRHEPDLVIGALPSVIGFQTLKAVIESNVNYVDISFMPEDPTVLDSLAETKGLTVVVDCGVMPGLGNIIAGHAAAELDGCHTIKIYVGGVPLNPVPPFNYKAPFAPSDVVEEYTRPARMLVDGNIVTKEPLTEVERQIFVTNENFYDLEAFNTDGLRTLLTLGIPNMVEKTLRYEGHADLMRMLRDEGMLDDPDWLYKHWNYGSTIHDITFLRVVAQSDNDCWSFCMIDQYDKESGHSSMARTTAFPCVTVARMILDGRISETGVIPPENLGKDTCIFHHILTELRIKHHVSVVPVMVMSK